MTSVVIVGSGFTGFECARRLSRWWSTSALRCPAIRRSSSPAPTTSTPSPRFVNRWAVSLAYLTDVFFDRSVVSLGLSTQDDAQFSTSEGIPLPKAD
jgi:hypothetical protein